MRCSIVSGKERALGVIGRKEKREEKDLH